MKEGKEEDWDPVEEIIVELEEIDITPNFT